jgi:hypothetical protein
VFFFACENVNQGIEDGDMHYSNLKKSVGQVLNTRGVVHLVRGLYNTNTGCLTT